MEKETQKFLEAEETATKLVDTLNQLHTEATSYQNAATELELVRQQLTGLIESTKEVVVSSHEVVKTLKKIGVPEVLVRLNRLRLLIMLTLGISVIALVVSVIAVSVR